MNSPTRASNITDAGATDHMAALPSLGFCYADNVSQKRQNGHPFTGLKSLAQFPLWFCSRDYDSDGRPGSMETPAIRPRTACSQPAVVRKRRSPARRPTLGEPDQLRREGPPDVTPPPPSRPLHRGPPLAHDLRLAGAHGRLRRSRRHLRRHASRRLGHPQRSGPGRHRDPPRAHPRSGQRERPGRRTHADGSAVVRHHDRPADRPPRGDGPRRRGVAAADERGPGHRAARPCSTTHR